MNKPSKPFRRTVSKVPKVDKFIPADLPMTEMEIVNLSVKNKYSIILFIIRSCQAI